MPFVLFVHHMVETGRIFTDIDCSNAVIAIISWRQFLSTLDLFNSNHERNMLIGQTDSCVQVLLHNLYASRFSLLCTTVSVGCVLAGRDNAARGRLSLIGSVTSIVFCTPHTYPYTVACTYARIIHVYYKICIESIDGLDCVWK